MPVIYMERSAQQALTEPDIKKLIDNNENAGRYEKLEHYYVGEQRILRESKKDSTAPHNRLVNNMAKYTTDTVVGYFMGKPVIYSSQNSDYLAKLQDIFDYNDEQDNNTELAKTCSIDGHSIEMLYLDESGQIRFAEIDPSCCILICESGGSELLAAVRLIYSKDKNGNHIKKAEYWDAQQCWYFQAENGGGLHLTDVCEHYWRDVPFTEYSNNKERLGDFEGIISLIDAYNRVQSNTANLFQYNDEAILKVIKLGAATSQDIAEMKEKGSIILEDGGDIEWLLKQLDDTAVENYKKRLREDMHLFSGVPNLTDENFGSNLSGVAVSYKLWGLEQLCASKERKFKRGLQRRIELISGILNIQGGSYDYRDVDIQFRRNKPQNMLEIAQIITTLAPELSRETRLKMLPTVDNVQDELDKLEQEKQGELGGFGDVQRFTQTLGAVSGTEAGNEQAG